MRILTFLHSFEPGGVERVALRLVRRWRETGIDALLFIGRNEGALHDELAQDLAFGLPPRTGWWSRPLETFWMIAKLPAEIRRTRPDVLFCSGNTYSVVAVAMKLILGNECPPIVAKISNDLVRPDLSRVGRQFHAAWARLQSRFIDCWVVMHASMRDEVAATIGAATLVVIPDPALTEAQLVVLQSWRPRRLAGHGRRFVAVGRLVPQKNYPLMLRAFAATAEAGDTLTIFGEGPARGRLEDLVRALSLQTRVHLAGHVPDAADQLLDHDVLLLSSRYEGTPAVLIEAIACGIPIVATDCGAGVRGLLADCDQARIVANGDTAGFGMAIAALSLAAGERAVQSGAAFTIEAGAKAYLDAFALARRAHAGHPVERMGGQPLLHAIDAPDLAPVSDRDRKVA